MPPKYSAPGVYVEEMSSGVRTITGVPTSITAFVGAALRGPVDLAVRVQGFAEFHRTFGGLARSCPMSYAVNQFFQNGGADALIVRVVERTAAAATGAADTLELSASSPGVWGDELRVRVDHDTRPMVGMEELFNLTIRDAETLVTERYLDVSVVPGHSRHIETVLTRKSALVRFVSAAATRPGVTSDPTMPGTDPMTVTPGSISFTANGNDGATIDDSEISDPSLELSQRGLWALERESIVNLLVIPPFTLNDDGDIGAQTRAAAAAYCKKRRAFYIADPLAVWDAPSDLYTGANSIDLGLWGLSPTENAALYFPRLIAPDPLQDGNPAEFAPGGAVAGIYSRTDRERGVWKSPAGRNATLLGVSGLAMTLTDVDNGQLNRRGVNSLRAFPATGRVVWGARTLRGVDSLASKWKYVAVRRLALCIEESVIRGTQWVVFEPNDEPLWAQLRLTIGAFMQTLFRQGAFQGTSPRDAYFVRCDRQTTTPADTAAGVVNIMVGFATLKPAEFLVIEIQQRALPVVV